MLIRDGKKLIVAATATSLTLADYPKPGAQPQRCAFRPGEFSDASSTVHEVQVIRRDGASSMHRIRDNDTDTLIVEPAFDSPPQPGEIAAVHLQLALPKIDTALCIGCGLCELECPVVGDRRAVYVTAEGETRSQHYQESGRNRSLRLIKTAGAGLAAGTLDPAYLALSANGVNRRPSGHQSGPRGDGPTCLHNGCAYKDSPDSDRMTPPTECGGLDGPDHKIDLRRWLT
jgi:ferredoxin